MKKQPERTAKTRKNLIDSFWELYKEKRIEKITIKEIADKAGVYRSTFYEYFSDVYELLAIIEDYIIKDFNLVWSHFFNATDFDSGIKHILSFYEAHGAEMAILLGPHGDQRFYLRIKDTARGILFTNTSADMDDHRIELLLAALPSAILSLLQYWYEHQDTVTLNDALAIGNQFMTKGMLPTLKDLGVVFSI